MRTTLKELRHLINESVTRSLTKSIKSAFFQHIKNNDKTKLDNKLLDNPDGLVGTLDVGDGYPLERETLGVGPVRYDKAVYGFKRKDQSLEGLMMDLVNKLSSLDDLEFTRDYYLPKKL